jgi:hypothetical protein
VGLRRAARIGARQESRVDLGCAGRSGGRRTHPGERANVQLKSWYVFRKFRCCPWYTGQLAKTIHVLQAREAKPGWKC